MATTVHEPPRLSPLPRPDEIHSGNGGGRNLVPAEGSMRALQDRSPEIVKTGMWLGLGAIAMSFAALTSALVVRQGSGMDWQHLSLPRILYSNTIALLASSLTLEIARRRIATRMRWLAITLALGLLFVAGQYMAWLQLKAAGLYLGTNPNSSFFYVFTGLHALHVLAGVLGLVYVISKLRRSVLRPSTFAAALQYWHFMGILWLYLLWVLWTNV